MNRTKQLAFLLFFILIALPALAAETDDAFVEQSTDSPRDTMRTFIGAMNDYKKGQNEDNHDLTVRIDDAIRTFNMSAFPTILRHEQGRETAIFLKEAIDRIWVVDFAQIPDVKSGEKNPPLRWRVPKSQIVITRQTEGDHAGEYLFSKETVRRAEEFFLRTKDRPYLEGSGKGANYQPSVFERKLPGWAKDRTFTLQNWQWLGLLVFIILGLFAKTITHFTIKILQKYARKTKGQWDDKLISAVEKPSGLIVATAFWFLSLHVLRISGGPLAILTVTLQIVLSVSLIWLVYRTTDVFSEYVSIWAKRTDVELDDQLVPLIAKGLRLFVVVFGALIAIQNLGVNVASLLAGLGIGGLAIALAAKDTAANFFGSIMILWDKPFRVGDYIIAGGSEGSVEEIGFRSTRIRTFYNSQVSIPNSIIANENIDNMGRRIYRRIKTTIGITYDTPPEKMEAFLEGIKNIVLANPHTRKDYFHVVFNNFGASSLDILFYVFVKVPDWPHELVERQNLFLEIVRLAKHIGVDFAFPTQSVHIETFPEKKLVREPHNIDVAELKTTAKAFGPDGESAHPSGQGIFRPPFEQ